MPININNFELSGSTIQEKGYGGIVTDGLVLHLDAGYKHSYPMGGTTWYDLKGSNNGTLTNGPTFSTSNGGSIVFDGSNDGIQIPGTNLSLNQMSICSWNYSSNYQQNGFMFEKTTNGSVNTQYSLFYNNDNTIYFRTKGLSTEDLSVNRVTAGVENNKWNYIVATWDGTNKRIYVNGNLVATSSNLTGTITQNSTGAAYVGIYGNFAGYPFNGKISQTKVYNRTLTASEILQNYNATKGRFPSVLYESLTYTASGNLTVTGNGTNNVSIFKTSGTAAWNNHAYSSTSFTAPCTIEFTKQAGTTDNGVSYAMIGWNEDPTTNASYDTLDYASYPFMTSNYQVYHNASLVQNGGTWSTSNKFYVVYGTDGFIRHYNGSTLLYSVNYGTGRTVYVDSSFYSVNSTFGGFSDIRVTKNTWNGTEYI